MREEGSINLEKNLNGFLSVEAWVWMIKFGFYCLLFYERKFYFVISIKIWVWIYIKYFIAGMESITYRPLIFAIQIIKRLSHLIKEILPISISITKNVHKFH